MFDPKLRELAEVLSKRPSVSTVLAAGTLSSAWTLLWFLVFFVSTWMLDIETTVRSCLMTFWFTVCVEAVLRIGENTDFISKLSNPLDPNAKGDPGYRLLHGMFIFLSGISLMALFLVLESKMPDVFALDDGLTFVGQNGLNSSVGFLNMWHTNWALLNTPGVFLPIFIGTFFRFMIYKRSARIAQ